jgi:hypothetical protein
MVSPYGKLSMYDGTDIIKTDHISTKYRRNKYLGIKYCEYFLCNKHN